MERRGLSLTDIQEVPKNSAILLAGPPGAGKSTFCHQVVLNGLAMDRPVIFVTTEHGPSEVIGLLREKGLGEPTPGALNFVDAFTETVGLTCTPRSDALCANCVDLNSISIATTRLQERIARKGILLAFDSLTSPYLFSGAEVIKFIRLFLSKFAAEGNSVVALMDEGCGKEEDLGAMMSVAAGIIKIEIRENSRVVSVVKHPKVEPTRIEVPTDKMSEEKLYDASIWDREMISRFMHLSEVEKSKLKKETSELFGVNLFWPNFIRWNSITWDPKRFPLMAYEVWKKWGLLTREMIALLPWYVKPLLGLSIPRDLSKTKDMKKLLKSFFGKGIETRGDCIMEYLDDASRTDEHYIRVYENHECWGFENVGTPLASHLPPMIAGTCKGLEKEERDWNAIETKCIGLGDPYCEWKMVPGEIPELRDSLKKDFSAIRRVHERLMHHLMGFMLYGKPLWERPRLGSVFLMTAPSLAMVGERYRMALRMGGAKAGKEVGEHLMQAGIGEDEAVQRVMHLLEYIRVGMPRKVTMDETIRIKENPESLFTKYYTTKWAEPSCYFTTGFLNGFFFAVKNQHVREIRCIAMGDPYCEWEIV